MNQKLKEAANLAESEPDQAMKLCSEVLDEHIDDEHAQQALFISAYVMMKCERFGLAYNIYQRCAELRPNQSEIYSNMGMCIEESRPDEAIKLFRKAQRINPSNPHPYANEGLIYLHKANPDRCIHLSNKALKLDPNLDSARQNRSLAMLMKRDWANGWHEFFQTCGVDSRQMRDYGAKEWTPDSKPGSIVVYGEQGCGDEIMYASCFKNLIDDGFQVIIDTDSRLESLFKRSFPECAVYGDRFKDQTRVLDHHKPVYQCAAGQLPAKYRLTDDSFKRDPYLKVDEDRARGWRAIFDGFEGKKIGVAWSGGNPNTGSKRRTFSPDDYSELFKTDNTFICLEYRPVSDEVIHKHGLKCYPDITSKGLSIDHLACMISQLDVVITSCTTVVYIAGALGIPCHVLVPECPGYRYHLDGDDFPWFESVKLHRFDKSWVNTVKRVIECCEL